MMERLNTFSALYKYILFLSGGICSYFGPLGFLFKLVLILFIIDFVTGIIKSVKLNKALKIRSKRLRWSFVKMLVYMFVMALTFYVCGSMQLDSEITLSVVKLEAWCIVYIEGLSIVENLKLIFPDDKFLKFIHYALSVEFLKYVPILSSFIKEKEEKDE
jgi:phage-related holin